MKKTLVIGSTCIDVMLRLPSFPVAGEDINVTSSRFTIGGTSYNVSDVLRQANIPYILCSPIGTGIYGEAVEKIFKEKGIPVFARVPNMENGCCYCIINRGNEHSFLSHHGAEYLFKREWFDQIDMTDVDSIYFSGLEMEEKTNQDELSWLSEKKAEAIQRGSPITFFFDPGPRALKIEKKILTQIMALEPVLHLNNYEAIELTQTPSIEGAASALHKMVNNHVIITVGDKGAYIFDHDKNKRFSIPGFKAEILDTIGAGDSHLGTIIACLKMGKSLEEAVLRANKYASEIVKIAGSTMPDDRFTKIF